MASGPPLPEPTSVISAIIPTIVNINCSFGLEPERHALLFHTSEVSQQTSPAATSATSITTTALTTMRARTGGNLLSELPEELLQDVIERLEKHDLLALNLVSRWAHQVATPQIWRDVELVDCRTYHGHEDEFDEHDDTPIIQKLLLFVNDPWLASRVHTLTHRCHLPPPAIFGELNSNSFNSQTLSTDPRTIKLVQLAVANLSKVQTLRIILGHATLTDALLRSFFDARRHGADGVVPIRKLWLENCRISVGLNVNLDGGGPYELASNLNFHGLESIRLRRLPMKSASSKTTSTGVVYSRGGMHQRMQDGLGSLYWTTVQNADLESQVGLDHETWLSGRTLASFDTSTDTYEESPLETFYETAHKYDQLIYEELALTLDFPHEILRLGQIPFGERAMQEYRGGWLDPDPSALELQEIHSRIKQRERLPSFDAAILMFTNASSTITSINLDWLLCAPHRFPSTDPTSMYRALFRCRFPHLRSLQWRNCVVAETRMPEGLYLLDHSGGLDFMEAHQGLLCLAWPMDQVFSHASPPGHVATRLEAVVDNLGRTLMDLRVDTAYSGTGEPNSEARFCKDPSARKRRVRFIKEFAAKMTKCESIKIEGGMPRDERREVVRAMHACPLKKIVMIGVCSTLGNTWGANGADVGQSVVNEDLQDLEEEDKPAIYDLGVKTPHKAPQGSNFEPEWGWNAAPPMLYTLASYHADTITELKHCGYKGAPLLFEPTPITTPLLSALKHFHNLESFSISMWLNTAFEGRASNDAEVIQYWCNQRNSGSLALVCINDEEPEGWEKELVTKYAPDALAWRITNFIGPFLSEQAKKRKGGVHVRASFCVGDWGGIFDVDLHIGRSASALGNVCLDYKGPREEFEKGRRKAKLEGRRWF